PSSAASVLTHPVVLTSTLFHFTVTPPPTLSTLSLHDALPIYSVLVRHAPPHCQRQHRHGLVTPRTALRSYVCSVSVRSPPGRFGPRECPGAGGTHGEDDGASNGNTPGHRPGVMLPSRLRASNPRPIHSDRIALPAKLSLPPDQPTPTSTP